MYSKILVAPIIVVKVQKRAISILEEVSAPGKYILEKETNILTELLATAQGFEFYADKENILLLRSNKTYRIDFTVLKITIIVQSGDAISVPTSGGKMVDKRAPTLIAFGIAITAIAVLISLIQ